MAYDLTMDDVEFLQSRYGVKALATAADRDLSEASLIADLADLRRRYSPYEGALVEVVRARRKAPVKLRLADRLLLDEISLQQATPSVVAAARAAQIAEHWPGASVHDVTCSIGAELMELSDHPGIGPVIGSDLDRVRLRLAGHNVGLTGGAATLLRANALTPTSKADVVIADPARRTGAGRVFRLDALNPPLLELLTVYTGRPLAVKCAPGLDYRMLRDRYDVTGQAQIVSLDGGVREACLWTGVGDWPERRATVMRTSGGAVTVEELTSDDPVEADAGEPGRWIIDPDGAVVRAGLVRQYATRHGLWQLDPQIAYLTGDTVPADRRGFEIVEQVKLHERAVRSALAAHEAGSVEILVRGVDVDPDRFRKRLRLKGTRPMALVLTRIGRTGVAFICQAATTAAD